MQAQNELNQQIFENSELKIYKLKYEDLTNDYNVLLSRFDSLESEKRFSDIEIANLRKETEELSSQLFSEANSMVSLARKETFEIKKTNDALKNEIAEKDNLIHILKSQLNDLKQMLETLTRAEPEVIASPELEPEANLQPESAASETLRHISLRNLSSSSLGPNKPNTASAANFVYAPTVQALRYDIKLYHQFKEFGERLYQEFKSGHHTSNSKSSYLEIREHKFYKHLLANDIEPALRLDEAPGVAWLSKKNLVTSMLIGKVSIEPVAAVNELYKTATITEEGEGHSSEPPVAFEDPCSLCGEQRNDTLDHSRLYILKVIGTRTIRKKKDNVVATNTGAFSKLVLTNTKDTVAITQEYVANQHPLCLYCLHRVRSVCELFAFLRGIKAGIWKFDNPLSCQKNWIECVRIRTKIFYSRIGITEGSGNLVNNTSWSFSAAQIAGLEGNLLLGSRNSGYFSNIGTRLLSPVMTSFGSFSKEPDLESTNSGYFSNRNSIIGSFWGTLQPSESGTANTLSASPSFKKKDHTILIFNGSISSFNSDKLEGKIDEVIPTNANGSPYKTEVNAENVGEPIVIKSSSLVEIKQESMGEVEKTISKVSLDSETPTLDPKNGGLLNEKNGNSGNAKFEESVESNEKESIEEHGEPLRKGSDSSDAFVDAN